VLIVRRAVDADIEAIEDMVDDFVKGHPAEKVVRSREGLRKAYFGASQVASLVVAVDQDRVVGMGQWTLIYEMFWGKFGATVEWFYVRPGSRGKGVSAAIVAEICSQVRRAGGEFLYGGGGDEVEALYERVAIGWPTNTCHVSAEAFQALADLAGKPPRDIVRGLPTPEMNRTPARARGRDSQVG